MFEKSGLADFTTEILPPTSISCPASSYRSLRTCAVVTNPGSLLTRSFLSFAGIRAIPAQVDPGSRLGALGTDPVLGN